MSSAVIEAPANSRGPRAHRSFPERIRYHVTAPRRHAISRVGADRDIRGNLAMTAHNGAAQRPVPAGDNIKVVFEDGIAWLKINRPEKRNAMSVGLADD